MSANQFFHNFDVVISALFEQLKVARTAKPDFPAVNRVQLDDAIADGAWLSLACTPLELGLHRENKGRPLRPGMTHR